MKSVNWDKVMKYMLLSGAAGTTIASLAGLKRLYDALLYYGKGPSEWDDDTMYVMKKQSAAEELPMSGLSKGILLAGVPLAFGGGFALTNYLFNKYMRAQAQNELDRSQLAFVNNSGYEAIPKKASYMLKQAETGISRLINKATSSVENAVDLPLGLGIGAALLTALASGFVTHQYLQSTWPYKKPKVADKPKKIKVINDISQLPGAEGIDVPETGESVAGLDKQSSLNGMELATRMLCNMNKTASVASDVVHACAQGRAQEFEDAVNTLGFFGAVNLVKGASSLPTNDVAKELAVTYCTKVASFAEPFRLAAASEYQYFHPEICKQAAVQNEECQAFLEAFANDFDTAVNAEFAVELGADESLSKSASVDDMFIAEAFKDVLCKLAASPIVDNSDMQSSSISSDHTIQSSYKSPEQLHKETEQYNAAQTTQKDKVDQDPIDGVMQSANKPDIKADSKDSDTTTDSSLQNV